MSKITFRADDDLVDELEALEISKSEAMREALRSYLGAEERTERAPADGETGAIDDLVRQRVDERLDERLREIGLDRGRGSAHARGRRGPEEVTVTVSLGDDARSDSGREASDIARDAARQPSAPETDATRDDERPATADETAGACGQCGEEVADDHVFCPNCGEKASRRLFCECGDEVRSDWSFCPGCGRRTPTADVLGRDTPS